MKTTFELPSITLEIQNAKEAEVLSKNCQQARNARFLGKGKFFTGYLGTDMPRHFSRKNIQSVSFLFLWTCKMQESIILVLRGRKGMFYICRKI